MAFFSQDLFEVFDEKSEPVSLSGKKRKRSNAPEGEEPEDEKKKFRAGGQEGSSSSDHAAEEGNVIDLTAIEESDTKEDAMV